MNLAETGLLQVDEQGRVDGFLVGKAHRIADWQAKKEEERYQVLFNRLRALAWQRKVYEEGGERLDTLRKRKLTYALQPHVKLRANELARIRRRARYYASPRIATCLECGATWCLLFRKGMLPKYCGDRCAQRYRYYDKKGER